MAESVRGTVNRERRRTVDVREEAQDTDEGSERLCEHHCVELEDYDSWTIRKNERTLRSDQTAKQRSRRATSNARRIFLPAGMAVSQTAFEAGVDRWSSSWSSWSSVTLSRCHVIHECGVVFGIFNHICAMAPFA